MPPETCNTTTVATITYNVSYHTKISRFEPEKFIQTMSQTSFDSVLPRGISLTFYIDNPTTDVLSDSKLEHIRLPEVKSNKSPYKEGYIIFKDYVISKLGEYVFLIFEKQYFDTSTNFECFGTFFEVSNKPNIKITQDRLLELLKEEEDYDDCDLLKPTLYAFDKTWNLLGIASENPSIEFPKAWVSTDGEGGIRLTWSKLEAEAEIRLICGAAPQSRTYLYYELGNEYGVAEELSEISLSNYVKLLNPV